MEKVLSVLAMLGVAGFASAADLSVSDGAKTLDELKWVARPIVIFADNAADPRVRQQLDMLEDRAEEMAERDVVVVVDTDPAAKGPIRSALHPRDFQFVLIGKDGQVKYRKPDPVPVREIMRLIDRMPMRQQEIEAQRSGG